MPDTIALIAAALRGDAVTPPEALNSELLAVARAHGVAPLLSSLPVSDRWNEELRNLLHIERGRAAALELCGSRELARLLEILAARGVEALLIKGACLSRAIYPSPELRPHSDVDLLIDGASRSAAARALEAAGYSRIAHVTGDVAFTQVHYRRTDESGVEHAVDLHWRICGPRALADRLHWDELHAARTPVRGLAPGAAGTSLPHALLIAAIHRTAHHANSERLIWLYDMHLLAERLSGDGWDVVAALAFERRIGPIVSSALDATRRHLGTAVPVAIRQRLASAVSAADPEAIAFLQPDRAPIDTLLSDWRALDGWGMRARFLREHLFPEAAYMRERYRTAGTLALPFLYVHRAVTGWRRWR